MPRKRTPKPEDQPIEDFYFDLEEWAFVHSRSINLDKRMRERSGPLHDWAELRLRGPLRHRTKRKFDRGSLARGCSETAGCSSAPASGPSARTRTTCRSERARFGWNVRGALTVCCVRAGIMRRQALIARSVAALLGLVGWVAHLQSHDLDVDTGLAEDHPPEVSFPPGAALPPNLGWNISMFVGALGEPDSGSIQVHILQFGLVNLGDAPVRVSGILHGLSGFSAPVHAIVGHELGAREAVIEPGEAKLFAVPVAPEGRPGLTRLEFLRSCGSVRIVLDVDEKTCTMEIQSREMERLWSETEGIVLAPAPASPPPQFWSDRRDGVDFVNVRLSRPGSMLRFRAPRGSILMSVPTTRVRSWISVSLPGRSRTVS